MTFKLRDYQRECVNAIMSDLAEVDSVAGILPCGAGKTEVFIQSCHELASSSEGSALVLSHMGLLTDQTQERFLKRRPDLRTGVLQGKRQPPPTARVVISTMQTSRDIAHIETLKKRLVHPPRWIIVDEMQMLPTPSYETIRSYFPDAKLIGFTATPFRGSRIMTGYVDRVSYSVSMQEIIDQGYLVPPTVYMMKEEKDVEAVMAEVLGTYLARERGHGAIVFMRSKADARALKVVFNEHGISCRAVTDDLDGRARAELLADFNAGKIDVLTTVNVLTAGFDSPRVWSVFMPYGASSPTAYIQRVGRALRPDVENGKSEGRVYVAGDAPSISAKTYERLTARLLVAGGEPRDHGSFRTDLELNDYPAKSETLHYTQQVVNAINRFEKLGMQHFAEMLDKKAFPPRYMCSISSLIASLPPKSTTLPGGALPATDKQLAYLFKAGFGGPQLTGLSKREAHDMISTLLNLNGAPARTANRFIVPEGTHKGKHASELPHAYCSIVLKRFPDSPVAKTILAWQEEKRHA